MTTADDILNRHLAPVADDGVEPFKRSWQPLDLATVLDGSWQPPRPTVGRRSDGGGLFYPGKVHTISQHTLVIHRGVVVDDASFSQARTGSHDRLSQHLGTRAKRCR